MDKKYQVFVSSTYQDLFEERQLVMQQLLQINCIPVGMEYFPAADDEQWKLIQRVIDDCDYYIVIIGGRYGSISSEGISYTEKEYEYAVSQKIPVMGFLHRNPTKLIVEKVDIDPTLRKKLDLFKERIETRHCKYWSNPDQLASIVVTSMIAMINKTPRIGWVKGNIISSNEANVEIINLRKRIEMLEIELERKDQKVNERNSVFQHGSDKFKVTYYVESPDGGITNSESMQYTWDEMFTVLSPRLLEETTETDLVDTIEADISRLHNQGQEVTGYYDRIHIYKTDWQSIKVQLLALALIEKTVNSNGALRWKLTSYGEDYLFKLIAKKK